MSALISLLRELAGLFVDDGSLALAILGIVVLAVLLAFLMPSLSLWQAPSCCLVAWPYFSLT